MITNRRLLVLAAAFAASTAHAEDPPPAKAPPPKPVVRKIANSVGKMAVSPDGAWVAAADWKGGGAVFSTLGADRRDLPGGSIRQLVFTPDSRFLVVFADLKDDKQKVTFLGVADGAVHEMDVTGEKPPGEHSLSPTRVWQIVPGAQGAEVEFMRSSGLETWDASKGEQVGKGDPNFHSSSYAVTNDRKFAAYGSYGDVKVVELATGAERLKIDDPQPAKDKAKKGTMVLGFHPSICGFTTDGAYLVVRIEKEVLKDPNALENANMSPEKRLAAIKKTNWIEAFRTSDGKSAWKADCDERVYDDCVRPGAAVIAEIEKDALKWRDAKTGALKGQLVGKKAAAAAVAGDGATFWVGLDDGTVMPAK